MEMCLDLPSSASSSRKRSNNPAPPHADYSVYAADGSPSPPDLSYSQSATPTKRDRSDYGSESPNHSLGARASSSSKRIKSTGPLPVSDSAQQYDAQSSPLFPDISSSSAVHRPSLNDSNPVSPPVFYTLLSVPPTNNMANQAVSFSACPQCQTWEHHFITSSRTCANCGYVRYFAKGSNAMQAAPPIARTYWRPTQYANGISYAHVREGFEEVDAPVIDSLASWAMYQSSYLLSYATQVAQTSADPSMKAFWLECSKPTQAASKTGGTSPRLTITNQGMVPITQLQADDLLGSFRVVQEEHRVARSRGGRGIVIAVLMCQGASLAFAVRLDEGTI